MVAAEMLIPVVSDTILARSPVQDLQHMFICSMTLMIINKSFKLPMIGELELGFLFPVYDDSQLRDSNTFTVL